MCASRRILIVDDDSQVLFVLSATLSRLSGAPDIVTAHDGRDALGRLSQAPFDLVITDLRLPLLDGVSLTEEIRESAPSTVVIWITAYSSKKLAADADRLAVHDFLEKPLEPAEFRRIVQRALDGLPVPS